MSASWSLRQLPVLNSDWTDEDFLRAALWESNAARPLITAARSGQLAAFATAWRDDLRWRRPSAKPPKHLLTLWTAGVGSSPEVSRVLESFRPSLEGRGARRPAIHPRTSATARWLPLVKALIADDRPATRDVHEVLLALELLWTLGDRLPRLVWWRLWKRTLLDLATVVSHPVTTSSPAEIAMTSGELPLLAGLVYQGLAGSRDLLRQGRRKLVKELVSRTDTDGTPHSELLPQLPLWLAPFVRSTSYTQQAGQSLWDVDQQQLLSDVAERAVSLCRADGRLAMSNGHATDALPVLRHASDLLGWPTDNPSRMFLKRVGDLAAGKKSRSPSTISVMPSTQSDWARFALLRTDWSTDAATVALSHHEPLPQIDVSIAGTPLLHGPWGLNLITGDAQLELAEEWSCVCWQSEPEADYAELQMEGPGGLRVERMVLLSREDQFLMLADAVSGAAPGPLALRSRLPLANGVKLQWDQGLRAGRLERDRLKVRMYPLPFPVDTIQSTPHRCTLEENQVTLEYRAEGRGIFTPIIIDFHPDRRRREPIWRKLTVTEEGRVVGSDVATAFRWQLGKQQWLIYRSLRKPVMPRAALGYHTGNSFAIGRFDENGYVDPILMVE